MSETTIPNIEPKKWYHCNYRIIGVAIGVVFLLLIVGNGYIYYLINNEKKSSTELISTILSNSAKEKSLIPDIIILNKNDSTGVKLDSTLKKELLKYLINRYNNDSSKTPKVFDIKPYLSSTEIKDEDKIVKHIEFLSETVKNAVEDSKRNIDTEISKINTWVTIWIGVIGFIGIFLPIVINIKSFDELKNIQKEAKDAKEDSKTAKDKSSVAMAILDTYKEQLEGLEENMKKVGEFEKSIEGQEKRIEEIGKAATKAEDKSNNTEKSLSILTLILKLKDIDWAFFVQIKTGERISILVRNLEEIHSRLSDSSIECKHPFVLDALRQLALRLYVLAPYPFIAKAIQPQFYVLSEFISAKLETGLTEDSFKEILEKFNDLITILKSK